MKPRFVHPSHPLGGMLFRDSEALVIQWRFPRSRKRRIRRKWAKVQAHWRPDPKVYRMEGAVVGHPVTMARLRKQLVLVDRSIPSPFHRDVDNPPGAGKRRLSYCGESCDCELADTMRRLARLDSSLSDTDHA